MYKGGGIGDYFKVHSTNNFITLRLEDEVHFTAIGLGLQIWSAVAHVRISGIEPLPLTQTIKINMVPPELVRDETQYLTCIKPMAIVK